ncbi:Cullin-associated NEDD8-dissociated protein 1 [Trifolium repens]|nr:Cullin-associated NEDD8-dissociated protein 1 [Trifolium repens]
MQAFPVIATSPLLSCVLEHAHRALRQATLGTLNSLIGAYGDKFGLSAYEVIVVELSGLISDSDLHMTGLAWNYAHTNKGREVKRSLLQGLYLLLESLLAYAKPSPQSGGIANKQALKST